MKVLLKLICISILFFCNACSSDEPVGYTVTVEVTSSTDDDIWIQGIGELDGRGVYFQKYIKRTFTTQYGKLNLEVRCDNPKVLITVKIWVNKKLVKDIIGNSYINTGNYIP